MSTFQGKFIEEEFKSISIDYFDEEVHDSQVFFLSHFHSDHVRGIQNPKFHNVLFENKESFLYCSKITKSMLERNAIPPEVHSKVRVLEKVTSVKLAEDKWITVTPLHAGHCPGSIMLLFEGFGKRILYTGDIRISEEDFPKFKRLHDREGQVLHLDNVYLDTTFANLDYPHFPTREESLVLIKKIIDDWLIKGEDYRVRIHPPANIGYEHLMVGISKHLGKPVDVTRRALDEYLFSIKGFNSIAVYDQNSDSPPRVHFCMPRECVQCSMDHSSKVLIVKPSALRFTEELLESEGPVIWCLNNFVRVAYSTHSSLNEVVKFLNYFKPLKFYPNVVTKPFRTAEELIKLIEKVMESHSEEKMINFETPVKNRESCVEDCEPFWDRHKYSPFKSSPRISRRACIKLDFENV